MINYAYAVLILLILLIYLHYDYKKTKITKYDKFCTNDCETKNVKTFKEINIDPFEKEPVLYKIKESVFLREFINSVKDFSVTYGDSGNATEKKVNIKYADFLSKMNDEYSKSYIFHYIRGDIELLKSIVSCAPPPNAFFINRNNLNAVIYTGPIYTGCNIHNHKAAINYLIRGKKLWVMFPNLHNNSNCLTKLNSHYPKVKKDAKEWFDLHYNTLADQITGLKIFIQNNGEAVYIPLHYYHLVINLENSYGIIYNEPYD